MRKKSPTCGNVPGRKEDSQIYGRRNGKSGKREVRLMRLTFKLTKDNQASDG